MENHKKSESIEVNAVSPEFMDVETMKKCINTYLDKSDDMVLTLYEILFLQHMGHKVEIRVLDSDFVKERRMKRKLNTYKKRKKMMEDKLKGLAHE